MALFQIRLASRAISAFAFLALVIAWVSIAPPTSAQRFGKTVNNRTGTFIAPPRQLSQVLKRAQSSIDEGSYSQAVIELGELLARDPGQPDQNPLSLQDFFVETDNIAEGRPASISLMRKARQMVGSLPKKGIENYQLRYGAIASRLLAQAAEQRDWDTVAMVRRKYFHTLAGFEASLLLSQREIYRGHAIAASLLLDEVSSNPRAIEHLGNQTYLLHAVACLLAKRPLPDVTAVVGETLTWPWEASDIDNDKTVTVTTVKELSQWMKPKLGATDRFRATPPSDYKMLGGTPGRSGDHFAQMPMSTVNWKKLTTETSPLEQKRIREISNELFSAGQFVPPSWTPLKVDDQVLMRTTKHLWGVDYRTGKVVWRYPIEDVAVPGDEQGFNINGFDMQDQLSDQLRQRVWNDLPYGQVTSDGERVFVLDDLSEMVSIALHPRMRIGGVRPANTRINTLAAVELATEGKLLWRVGQGNREGPLSDVFFLGPPLPLEGRLYVLAEISGDINLLCLDPVDGNELWRQHLVAIESGEVDADPIRRMVGAMPTYHEGLLICPTGAGTLVAVDLIDRTLRWGATFRRETPRTVNSRQMATQAAALLQRRWHNGIAHASGSRIIFTPPETSRLLGLDLFTGQYIFQAKTRLNMRYLAGIHGDRFLVAGATRVRAFDLATGASLWSSPKDMLSSGNQIAGVGAFGQDSYLVPVTGNELIQLSLDDGSVIERRQTEYAMGNLVAVDGDLLVQGPDSLASAFGQASLDAKVARMLDQNPRDVKALVHKAELLLQQNESEAALKILNEVRQMDPRNDGAIKLSISAMLGLLREQPDLGEKYVQTLEQLIDLPDAQVELLSLRADAAIKSSRWSEATEHLVRLSSLLINEKIDVAATGSLLNSPGRFCTLDSWVAARMDDIHAALDDGQRTEINQKIADSVNTKIQRPTRQLALLRLHFSAWPACQPIIAELVNRYLTDGDFLAAERTLMGSRLSPFESSADYTIDQLVLLARCYQDVGYRDDAADIVAFVQDQISSGKQVTSTLQQEITNLTEQVTSTSKTIWPSRARVKWQSADPRSAVRTVSNQNSKTTVLAGKQFDGWRLMADNGTLLEIRDRRGSRYPVTVSVRSQRFISHREAFISGSLLLVMMSDQMSCVDLSGVFTSQRDTLRWSHKLGGDSSDLVRNRPTAPNPFGDRQNRQILASDATGFNVTPELKVGPVLGDRVLVLRGGELIALNLLENKIMWRNSLAPKSGEVICSGDEVAVVSFETQETVVFNLHDGQKQRSFPWTHGRAWASVGPHVLSYVVPTGTKIKHEIRLVDPLTDRILLSQDSLKAERGRAKIPSAGGVVIDGRYLAWMQSDGQAVVWDILRGTELARVQVPAYQDLQEVRAIRLGNQLVLLPKRKPSSSTSGSPHGIVAGSGTSHRATSAAFAIDLSSGKLMWQKEFDQVWGCSLDQSSATPVLLLTRSYTQKKIAPDRNKKMIDLLALDLQTGQEVARELGHPVALNDTNLRTKIIIQEANRQLVVTVGRNRLVMDFQTPESKPDPPIVAEPLPSQ